jgi:hypothetical protein
MNRKSKSAELPSLPRDLPTKLRACSDLIVEYQRRKNKMASTSIVEILKNLKAVVGEVAFDAAVAAVQGKHVTFAEPAAAPKKERKQRVISEETAAKVRENMTNMQAFTKFVRTELGEETPFKEAQKIAGERWKGMSAEERADWVAKNVQKEGEAPEAAEKTVSVAVPAEVKPPKSPQVTAVKEPAAPAQEPKKGKGRPPKKETTPVADAE